MNTSQQLSRSLGLRLVIVVVISNIIGSGVYKKVAPMAAELNSSAWVLGCWLLGGIISLLGALCNAEVAGLLADTGGEYVYYKKIYNRFFAFVFGWSCFTVIETAAISSLAYVFAQSLISIIGLPQLFSSVADFNIAGVFYPLADFTVKLTAIILIIMLTWINSKGIKASAGFNTALLLMIVAGIALIIIFGLSSKQADPARIFQSSAGSGSVNFSSVFTAMLAAFWAYEGWASIGYLGGEIKNPNRNIPLGIATGVTAVIVVYLLVNFTYLSLLPIQELRQIHESGNRIVAIEAVRKFWGANGAMFISILILVTTLGCTNAAVMSSCRPYYAMAREGFFFKGAAKLNKNQVPGNSLSYQCIWASVLVLSGSFDQLTDMIIFAVFIYYGATTLGVFILRKKMPDAPRPYKVWGYPLVPAFVLLFCAVLVINTIFARPREAGIGLVLMLTGVPMYWWFMRKLNRQSKI